MMVRGKRYVLANFKMHKKAYEVKEWVERFAELIYKSPDIGVEVGLAPSFPYIQTAKDTALGTRILVGAQNMHFEEKGAFTGEVAVSQIKDLGCDFVILGHSERRHIFGETDELIGKKVVSALSHGILPVFCIGETKEERESGRTYDVLKNQLSVLARIPDELRKSKFVIAYEPVWAIGTGIPATPEQIKEAMDFIKEEAGKFLGDFSVIYGGSINENVAEEIKNLCDGGLVGSASLDPERFFRIARGFSL